jgi:hypothetical protein
MGMKRQLGLGMIGWLFILMLFGGVLTMAMKLVPLYTEHRTMSGVLDGLALEDGLVSKRNVDIQDMILKRFSINNVRDFDWKKNMAIKREEGGVKVVLDYEARVPLMGNVDLVATFYKEVTFNK